jgi:hypothetical protein
MKRLHHSLLLHQGLGQLSFQSWEWWAKISSE